MKQMFSKRGMVALVLVVVALVSILGLSKVMTNPNTYAGVYETLNEKRAAVIGLSATVTATSVAVAAIPSDATTPIANKIADLTSYLMLVFGVIVLEELLLTVFGAIATYALIPLACFLCVAFIYTKWDLFKKLAFKSAVLAIALMLLIPVSVGVSNLIETSCDVMNQVENTKSAAEEVKTEVEEAEEGNWWSAVTTTVKNAATVVAEKVKGWAKKAGDLLNDLINTVTTLIITSCVIPLLVLMCFIWLVKYIFGIKLNMPKLKKKNETKVPALEESK